MRLWWWTPARTARHDDPMSTCLEPYSPYCGLVVNEYEQYEKVQGAPLLAVSTPSRTGKTRRSAAAETAPPCPPPPRAIPRATVA